MPSAAALLVTVALASPGVQRVCVDGECVEYASHWPPRVSYLGNTVLVATPGQGWWADGVYGGDECVTHDGSSAYLTSSGLIVKSICGHQDGFSLSVMEER